MKPKQKLALRTQGEETITQHVSRPMSIRLWEKFTILGCCSFH